MPMISDLPNAGTVTGEELLEIVQDGQNRRIDLSRLPSAFGASIESRSESFTISLSNHDQNLTPGVYKGHFVAPYDMRITEVSSSRVSDLFRVPTDAFAVFENQVAFLYFRKNHELIRAIGKFEGEGGFVGFRLGQSQICSYPINKGDYISFDVNLGNWANNVLTEVDNSKNAYVTLTGTVYPGQDKFPRTTDIKVINPFDDNLPVLEYYPPNLLPGDPIHPGAFSRINDTAGTYTLYFNFKYKGVKELSEDVNINSTFVPTVFSGTDVDPYTTSAHIYVDSDKHICVGAGRLVFTANNLATGSFPSGAGAIEMTTYDIDLMNSVSVGKLLYVVSTTPDTGTFETITVYNDMLTPDEYITPINDDPIGALNLFSFSVPGIPNPNGFVTGSLKRATVGVVEPTPTLLDLPTPVNTVWYNFEIVGTKHITLDTTGSLNDDMFLYLWKWSGNDVHGNPILTVVAGNDDITVSNTNAKIVMQLTAGIYYVSVDAYSVTASGQFKLSYSLTV